MSNTTDEIIDQTSEITVNSGGLILAGIFVILLPFVLSFIWIKYHQGKILAIGIGILGFVVSIVVERIILSLSSLLTGVGNFFFYLIVGLFPGIFEESGRYICYKLILKNHLNSKNTSVSYGIGHGGIESILVGIQLIANVFLKNKLIKEKILTESITFGYCLLSMLERVSAVTLQIALSVLVFKTIKDNKSKFYFIAIVLHDFVDMFPLLKIAKVITNLFVLEIIILLICMSIAVVSYKIYQNFIDVNGEYSEFSPIGNDTNKKEMGARSDLISP